MPDDECRPTIEDEDPDGVYMRGYRAWVQSETGAIARALRALADDVERLPGLRTLDIRIGKRGQRTLRLRLPLTPLDGTY